MDVHGITLIPLVTWLVLAPPSTVPSSLSLSLRRPDIVLISNDCITLLVLSVVTNTKQHLLAANLRKEDRYSSLLLDLAHTGLSVELVTIKVRCLGHFLPSSVTNVCRVCHLSKHSTRYMFEQAAPVAISCSYQIFNAHSSELWDVSELLNSL